MRCTNSSSIGFTIEVTAQHCIIEVAGINLTTRTQDRYMSLESKGLLIVLDQNGNTKRAYDRIQHITLLCFALRIQSIIVFLWNVHHIIKVDLIR